jgi:hypothetical protein
MITTTNLSGETGEAQLPVAAEWDQQDFLGLTQQRDPTGPLD